MERGEGSSHHGKRPLEEASEEIVGMSPEVKKQWKNPLQVQILEAAYAVTPKPSASVKEELARRTGLDYKQVQYWFGNRRYLDRHGPRKYPPRRNDDGRHGQSEPRSAPDMSMALVVAPRFEPSVFGSIDSAESSFSWGSPRLQVHGAAHSVLPGVVPALPLATMMPQPLPTQGLHHEALWILAHIENRLGHTVRSDGPALGTEFRALPPGAFDAPLANARDQMASSKPCDSQIIQRPRADMQDGLKPSLQETMPSSNSVYCLVPSSSNEGDLVAHGVHELNPKCSSAVHEYQFFPTQPSRSEDNERVDQTSFHVSSTYKMVSSPTQNLAKPSFVASVFSSQGQVSNVPQEVRHEIVSSDSTGHQIFAADALCNSQPAAELEMPFKLSNKTNAHDANAFTTEKLQILPSVPSVVNNIEHHTQTATPNTVIYQEGNTWAEAGPSTNYLGRGLGENGSSTGTTFKEVNNNSDESMRDQITRDKPYGTRNRQGHGRFFLRPRKEPLSARAVPEDCAQMRYFADTSVAPIIAEWNENEKRAIYFLNDDESSSSDSSGSDSNCSNKDKYQATGSSESYPTGKSAGVIDVESKGKAACKEDQDELEDMDVDKNKVDDEEMTEDWDYEDDSDDDKEDSEDTMALPLSSEQTF